MKEQTSIGSPSPTFVAMFADGTRTRMTTWHDATAKRFELGRGISNSKAAYESRMKQPPPPAFRRTLRARWRCVAILHDGRAERGGGRQVMSPSDRAALSQRLFEAINPFSLVDEGDSYAVIEAVFAGIVVTLRRHFPDLTTAQLDLILADDKRDAEKLLVKEMDGLVNLEWVLDDIVDELAGDD
jgi:hypothetical protein